MYPASKFIAAVNKDDSQRMPADPVTLTFENGKMCLQGAIFEIEDPDCQADIQRDFDSKTKLIPGLIRMQCIVYRGRNSLLDEQTLVNLPGYVAHLRPFSRGGVVSLVGEIILVNPASDTWTTSDFPKTLAAKVLANVIVKNDPMQHAYFRGRFDRAQCRLLTPITGISKTEQTK